MKTLKNASETLKNKKLYVFDMDGTIYLGDKVFDFAIRFINHLRESGKRVLFFTNNASRSKTAYIERLSALGFAPTEDEIMTSGDVTKAFLARYRAGKSVYLLGTAELKEDFKCDGIKLVGDNAKRADIVVSSFDKSLTYKKLFNACNFIANGAEFLSTHPDFVCPIEGGIEPDSGAIAAAITAATGATPKYFGKPCKETLNMICEVTGFNKDDICVFGDRLYTDIAFGRNNGVTAVLVMTGETTAEQLEHAKMSEKPDFTFASLDDVDKLIFGDR